MPRSSPGAMRWRRRGPLSIRSKKPGWRRRVSRPCSNIPRDLGVRKKQTNCWRETAGPGGGYERTPLRSSSSSSVVLVLALLFFPERGREKASALLELKVMPAPTETFAPGLPVEIGKIDRELKKLWESGSAMTRASLMNLAVYSEEPGSLSRNTKIISKITEDHACRAILIGAKPGAKENRVEAWISAHCHVSRAGGKQICSEQLSFLLEGPSARLLPNIVFSQLDSDLPFYLWWQGDFHDPVDPQLWAWVDRVIYDSQAWSDFGTQMQRVETAQAEAKHRIVLCDLNWTRLYQFRLALAQFFDHPASQFRLREIETIEIDLAPGYR